MKRTRRICALGMAGIMAFSMAACGSKDGGNGGNGDGSPKGGDGGHLHRQIFLLLIRLSWERTIRI